MAYPWPAGATAHSGRASATGFRPASVALKAKRTTSPVRTDASAGATATCATAFGTTVIDQLSLAEPAPAVIVARPGARAVTRPNALTSSSDGRLDFQATWS